MYWLCYFLSIPVSYYGIKCVSLLLLKKWDWSDTLPAFLTSICSFIGLGVYIVGVVIMTLYDFLKKHLSKAFDKPKPPFWL